MEWMLKGDAHAAYLFELLHDYLNKSNSSETFYSLVYLCNGSFVHKSISKYHYSPILDLIDMLHPTYGTD